MSSPISEQVEKLKKLLFDKDTAKTLGQGLSLIFIVIREALVLAWLAFCWAIVAVNWLGHKTVEGGQSARNLYVSLQEENQNRTASDIASGAGKSLVDQSKNTFNRVVETAKQQVGINK
ncbi:MAG: hypothetical protein ACTS2F_13895 [Thainema sp.]